MRKITSKELRLLSIFIGFVATLMILFPTLVAGDSNISYTGLQIAFGYEFANLGGYASGQIEFSIMNVIIYALPLIGALFLLFTEKGNLVSTFTFGIAAILLFLVPEFTTATATLGDSTIEILVEWNYGIGLIFAASLSIIGLFIGLFRIYKKI